MKSIPFVKISKEFLIENYNVFKELSKQIENDYWTLENYLYELPLKWELSEAYILNKQIAGFNIASHKQDHFYIHRIVVSKKYHNRGIGKALIFSLINKAKSNNIKSISLKVAIHNTKAFNFYLKLGFKKVDETQNYADPRISSYILQLNF